MNFSEPLLAKVLDGSKTVTRRPVKYRFSETVAGGLAKIRVQEPCRYKVGKTYAVQPGRGQRAVGRIRILDVQRVRLGVAATWSRAEARREGFSIWRDLMDYWTLLYGSYDPTQLVDRIEFELVEVGGE